MRQSFDRTDQILIHSATEPGRAPTGPNLLDFLLVRPGRRMNQLPIYPGTVRQKPEGVALFQLQTRGSSFDQPANHDVECDDYSVFVVLGGAVVDPVREVAGPYQHATFLGRDGQNG